MSMDDCATCTAELYFSSSYLLLSSLELSDTKVCVPNCTSPSRSWFQGQGVGFRVQIPIPQPRYASAMSTDHCASCTKDLHAPFRILISWGRVWTAEGLGTAMSTHHCASCTADLYPPHPNPSLGFRVQGLWTSPCRGTSLIRNSTPLKDQHRALGIVLL